VKKKKIIKTKKGIGVYNIRKREEESEDKEKVCVVCLTNIKYIAALPCGHIFLCGKCAPKFRTKECALCKAKIQSFHGIYS